MPNSPSASTIKDCPTAGDGVHRWIYHVVCRMVEANEEDIDIVTYCEEHCTRPLQVREVENAILSRRKMLQRGVAPRPRWPRATPSVIAKITSQPTSVASLFELSPMPVEEYTSEKIIDYLFPENPLLCCGVSSRTFATRHREDWRGKLERMQLIVPNTMSAKYGKTQTGKESMHTMENTGPRTYLVVEFDEGSHDDHAALLWYLNSGISPLICAVMSGNKSLHGWFKVDSWTEEAIRNFFERATSIGADPATWTKSQFVRMPNGTRDNGATQRTIYLSDKLL